MQPWKPGTTVPRANGPPLAKPLSSFETRAPQPLTRGCPKCRIAEFQARAEGKPSKGAAPPGSRRLQLTREGKGGGDGSALEALAKATAAGGGGSAC